MRISTLTSTSLTNISQADMVTIFTSLVETSQTGLAKKLYCCVPPEIANLILKENNYTVSYFQKSNTTP